MEAINYIQDLRANIAKLISKRHEIKRDNKVLLFDYILLQVAL